MLKNSTYHLRSVSLTKTPNERKLNSIEIFYSHLCFQNIFKFPSISNYGNEDPTSTLCILVSLKYFFALFFIYRMDTVYSKTVNPITHLI